MIISRTRRAFKVKQKAFFLVSQVLSFRHKKRTSTNVVDTTFKDTLNLFHKVQIKAFHWKSQLDMSLMTSDFNVGNIQR